MPTAQPRCMPSYGAIRTALAICVFLPHLGAQGAPQEIEHRIEPGDTLEALSIHYLGNPGLWPQLQAYNRVANPRRLRIGSMLRIPMGLLSMGTAEVSFIHGQARITPPGDGQATALQAGQPLAEGARLQVAPDSFITVRLADGTLIRVHADTDLQLLQLRRRGRAGNAQSVLDLRRGSVETSVPPSKDGTRRFEIRTPKASTSVRGTYFAVMLPDDDRTLTAVTEGRVAVESPGFGTSAMVDSGYGVAVAASGQLGTPQPLLPAPDLSGVPTAVHDADFLSLTLSPIAGAVAYQVQLARDASLSEVVRESTFPSPAVRMRTVEDGDYNLAVRAIDGDGLPGLVAHRAITVKAHPVPPLYQAPVQGATISRTQGELSCTQVAGSVRYRIQVASDAGFAAPVLDEAQLQRCGTQVATLAPGNYYWRAASVRDLPGGGSDQGPYAAAQSFTVADNPSAPTALQVIDEGAGPLLRWAGEPGQSFHLQLAATDDFATPLVDQHLDSPSWTVTGIAAGSYFVRIRTRDSSGLESDFSRPYVVLVQAAVQSGSGIPVTSADGRQLSRP